MRTNRYAAPYSGCGPWRNTYDYAYAEDKMHILLINVPSRRGAGGKFLPLGLLYVGALLERAGHVVKIIDPYLKDPELKQFDAGNYMDLDFAIDGFKPSVIGFGGIASSYGRTKKLSKHIKLNFPTVLQIAGGALASVYQLLLMKTNVDIVFHGETERTLPAFLKATENNQNWTTHPGISFKYNGFVQRNENPLQIENLDDIPMPAYHLINIHDYADGVIPMPIITARGCTNACSFCYRHMKGYRQHSVNYVINHLRYLNAAHDIDNFLIGDELFNFSQKWVLDFCYALKKSELNIKYLVAGARVDRMTEGMLRALKDSGCVNVFYGQESGSSTILKEYRKGVSVEANVDMTKITKEIGLPCTVQLVIGSPGETDETIAESIKMLKDIGEGAPSVNYLLPFPETPIWKYAMEANLIPDVEAYLDRVADEGGAPIVNLTSVPDAVWRSWGMRIKMHAYANSRESVALRMLVAAFNKIYPYVPESAIKIAKEVLL